MKEEIVRIEALVKDLDLMMNNLDKDTMSYEYLKYKKAEYLLELSQLERMFNKLELEL